jgi:hypothetical protein
LGVLDVGGSPDCGAESTAVGVPGVAVKGIPMVVLGVTLVYQPFWPFWLAGLRLIVVVGAVVSVDEL